MTSPASLGRAVRLAAWGYFFLYLNFTLSVDSFSLNLLPAFAGWYLLLQAVDGLKAERPQLALLEGFAAGLILWSALEWLPWEGFGLDFPGLLSPVDLLAATASMYFHFHLLTQLSLLALERLGPAGPAFSARLLRARTWSILLQTATLVFARLSLQTALASGGPWERVFSFLSPASGVLSFLLLLACLAFCLFIMAVLFRMSKALAALTG